MSTSYPQSFKEICESVLEESDGRAVQIASVALGRDTSGDLYLTNPTHRNVVKWVAEEYLRIQLSYPYWEFHHKRGTFLNVVANKESYQKSGVRSLDNDSVYFMAASGTTHYPVCVEQYDWWQYQEKVGSTSTSTIPTTLIEGPNDEWILWPTPTATGTIKGDWWVDPFELVEADDVPCWDAQYYSLLKWGTLDLYASEFAGEGSAQKLRARIARMLPSLQLAFDRDYKQPVTGIRTLF